MEKLKKFYEKKKMKNLFLLFLFCISCYAQTLFISDCDSLQKIITNNYTVEYELKNDLNCSDHKFVTIGNSTQSFFGVLNGMNKTIFDLTIESNSNLIGKKLRS